MTTPGEQLQQAAKTLRTMTREVTPGPWRLDGPFWWRGGDSDPDCTYAITAGEDRRPVAVLPEGHDRRETSDTDAALIALMDPNLARLLAGLMKAMSQAAYDDNYLDDELAAAIALAEHINERTSR